MNRLLILGSSGLLGSVISPILKNKCSSVFLHSREKNNIFKADLTNVNQIKKIIDLADPDTILNLAALADVDACEDPQKAYEGNVSIVENIIDAVLPQKSDRDLIQISTDHVYNKPGYQKENNISLTNYYAFSKYTAEIAVQRVQGCNLRTNFFGKGASSDRMSFTDWLRFKLIAEEKIQVFQDVWFNPISMTTLALQIKNISDSKLKGVFNLGSRDGMSKADFAFIFAEEMRLPTKYISRVNISDVNYIKTYRPRDMRMDVTKIENALGEIMPSLNQEITQVVKEYTDDI